MVDNKRKKHHDKDKYYRCKLLNDKIRNYASKDWHEPREQPLILPIFFVCSLIILFLSSSWIAHALY